jgi:hypothetical protein
MGNIQLYYRIFYLILNVPCTHLPSTSPPLIILHHNIVAYLRYARTVTSKHAPAITQQ